MKGTHLAGVPLRAHTANETNPCLLTSLNFEGEEQQNPRYAFQEDSSSNWEQSISKLRQVFHALVQQRLVRQRHEVGCRERPPGPVVRTRPDPTAQARQVLDIQRLRFQDVVPEAPLQLLLGQVGAPPLGALGTFRLPS